jgi:heavy metal sensor kinase
VVVFRSIRVRLTLLYVALLAVILAFFAIGVYMALREALYSNLDDSLDNRVKLVQAFVQVDQSDPAEAQFPGDPAEHEEFIRVYDNTGEIVFDNTSGPAVPEDRTDVEAALSGDSRERTETAGDVRLVIHTEPLRGSDRSIVGAVEVGLSDDDARDTLRIFVLILAIAYGVSVIGATIGGLVLATRALAPIDRLTSVARRITAEDLSQRLDLDLPNDELGRLALTFDEMIARLDDAFRRQRQFTADASHELRTPMTVIKGQTEVALQRPRTPEEYRDVLRAVNAEIDRMMRLVTSLLTLARADARQLAIARDNVTLGPLIHDAVDQLRALADSKRIAVAINDGEEIHLVADQDLLLQLLLNLLDNAFKYTTAGGSVDLSWSRAGHRAEIRIVDTGPGISPEDLPHIFDRFYRADSARGRAEGGVGLGLSIAHWIAEAHGGTIRAESTLGQGTAFVVHLPFHQASP